MHLLAAFFYAGWFFWDPEQVFWTIPWVDWPIFWYGLLFAAGFFIGYLIMRRFIYREVTGWEIAGHPLSCPAKQMTAIYMDRLLWYVLVGTIVGARLGHVLFYGWPYYASHPGEIVKIWEGGLASHGGAIGVVIALIMLHHWAKRRYPMISFLHLFDMVVVPVALVGAFIRVGNFFNQEILGTPSNVPWAVIFGHPADGSTPLPRHPVQLYEAAFYLLSFLVLYGLQKIKKLREQTGILTGIFFLAIFGFRFLIEFFKMPEGSLLPAESFLLMGQYLSIPFILLGIGLVIWRLARPISSRK